MQKKVSSRSVIVAAIVALAALQASNAVAQWYVAGGLGASILSDADVTDTIPGGSITGDASFDPGVAVSGAVGFEWRSGLRAEGEFSYRGNDVDDISIGGVSVPVEADIDAFGFMANVFYTFSTGTAVSPFVGGGIGVAVLGLDVESVAGVALPFDETDTVFAYQIGGGLAYAVNTHVTMDMSYKYFATEDPEFKDGVATVDAEYQSHTVMAGIRYKF